MNQRTTSATSLSLYSSCILPTAYGTFKCSVYRNEFHSECMTLSLGHLNQNDSCSPVLTRIHSSCLTGETLGSLKCECGQQLQEALYQIAQRGRGILIYLFQEGRGIGLGDKIRAYHLQNQGMDTVDANRQLGLDDDLREYQDALSILNLLGIQTIDLMTNNPLKIQALEKGGVHINSRIPIEVGLHPCNRHYLETKHQRMGHLISESFLSASS